MDYLKSEIKQFWIVVVIWVEIN